MSNLPALVTLAEEYLFEAQQSEGEITERLDELATNLVKKVDACAYVIDHLESMEEFFAKKEKEFKAAKKRVESAKERLKDKIKFSMSLLNSKEIAGEYNRFTMTKCQPSLVIYNEELIPNKFKETVVKPNNSWIKEALLKGEDVPGARLEGGASLRKYILLND